MATPISGISGNFYVADSGGTAAEVASIRSWTIDVSAAEVDVSGFDGSGWKATVAGLKSWTATVEGQWTYGDTGGMEEIWDNLGDEVDCKFYVDLANTKYFSGSAKVISISPSTAVDSSATFSATLSGDGALSYLTS